MDENSARQTLYDVITHSADETIAFGQKLATMVQPPCAVLLEGDLGSGKTTLTKGIVAGLGVVSEDEVTSPSFTLVHEYGERSAAPGQGMRVYHADLYRIEGEREIESLGLDELLSPESAVFIEWGDKLTELPSGPKLRIRLEILGGDERRIVVEKES